MSCVVRSSARDSSCWGGRLLRVGFWDGAGIVPVFSVLSVFTGRGDTVCGKYDGMIASNLQGSLGEGAENFGKAGEG